MMEPAEWVWVAALVGLGIADIVLGKKDLKLLTHSAREHKPLTVAALLLFLAHVLDVLGPIDPFRRLGRWV